MPSNQSYSFVFPRPRGAAAWILTINIVCFFLAIILGRFSTTLGPYVGEVGFIPSAFFSRHRFWQPFTYSFLDTSVLSIAFSLLMIWQLGAMFSSRKFLEVYFTSLIVGGLLGAVLSYTKIIGIGPDQMISSAWPGILGLVCYYGTTHANENLGFWGLPASARTIALIFVGIEVALLLMTGNVHFVADLCGGLTGFAYAKMLPTRGMKYAASESYFGFRNRIRNVYYRWKRKRATRKFEVYMSKQDRKIYFDQYGNYIHPEDQPGKDKDDKTGRSGWVN